jgi:hypothetical protein
MEKKRRFANLGVMLAALLMVGSQTPLRASPIAFNAQVIDREFHDAIEIENDAGGYVAEYALRLYEMKEARRRVRFAGACDSACTLFLALPASQTCITESAYFRFHAPSAPSTTAAAAVQAYMMRKYPKWVRTWIVAQGGLSDHLATMSYQYAQNFMRSCYLERR